MEVKDIISTRRTQLDMTMKELSQKVGVSEATICRWESGDIENMKRDKILNLANALQISPSLLMGWTEYKAEHILSERERTMIDLYRQLNDAGKSVIDTQLNMMVKEDAYRKGTPLNESVAE